MMIFELEMWAFGKGDFWNVTSNEMELKIRKSIVLIF